MTENKPVSEKQLKWLRQFKVPEDIIATLNSKSASDILSAKFGEDKDEEKVEVVKPGMGERGELVKRYAVDKILKPYEKDTAKLMEFVIDDGYFSNVCRMPVELRKDKL